MDGRRYDMIVTRLEMDAKLQGLEVTAHDKRVMYAVLSGIFQEYGLEGLSQVLGSQGAREAEQLLYKFDLEWNYGSYCRRRGIKVDELTADDMADACQEG